MCGIAGMVSLKGEGGRGGPPVDMAVLQRMTDLQSHRGPDGEGFMAAWTGDGQFRTTFLPHTSQWDDRAAVAIGLGHRRLAILDLSERGRQPMTAGDGGQWIVFNGEIYNHRELRAQLESLGLRFTSRTDTEVLLQAYRRWGDACLDRLEGMFAFAIWDSDRGRLFCARDRLGIKPFYYAHLPGRLAFASEMKGLLAIPEVAVSADDEAVVEFLVHGNCDYGERTLLRAIKALPPAHALAVDTATGHVTTWAYWRLAPRAANGLSDSEHVERLRALLQRTACSHLLSDVRVGSCLSGGLDSSAVVSLIAGIRREQPDVAAALGDSFYTFTACYGDRAYDERDYALAVAHAAGASSHLVFPSAEDFLDTFERMAWHQDMPFGEPTFYAQWRVMRAAREAGVKVLLDGQGGDEVFGGYAKFRYAYLASLLRAGRLGRLTGEVGAMLLHRDSYVLDIRNGYRYLPQRLSRWFGVDSGLRQALRADWNRAAAAESTPATRWWRYASRNGQGDGAPTLLQRMQVDDICTDTLPMLLRMEDRSSMAFSLEARVPLLDHTVVEYGVSLPDRLKIRNGWSKFAVRQAMQGIIPDPVRLRKSKLGFAVPARSWLSHDLRPHLTALLQDSLRCQTYVDPAILRRWYHSTAAAAAPKEAYLGLFRVLSLEMWMRAFGIG